MHKHAVDEEELVLPAALGRRFGYVLRCIGVSMMIHIGKHGLEAAYLLLAASGHSF